MSGGENYEEDGEEENKAGKERVHSRVTRKANPSLSLSPYIANNMQM